MSKQIDELGIQLGRSLAEVVKNALAIAQETFKENPVTFSAQANVESVAVAAEEEPKKPAPKKTTARKSTAKKAAPKAEEPKPEPEPVKEEASKPEPVKEEAPKPELVKEEAPKAERQVRLVDVAGMGKAIMAHGDYHEKCMEIMGGKILKDLDPSEYNEVYAKLRDLLHRIEGDKKSENTDPFA
jgi:pollen-specific leucine-rich repeat extensin-like protein 1|nr:MAG TPA: hypothetical protein [Caudoviricetes sp.]